MIDILKPFVAPEIPQAHDTSMPAPKQSPFEAPVDIDALIHNLVLDRPLKLVIPACLDTANYSYGFANSTPQSMRRWKAKGWQPVTNKEAIDFFDHLSGGVDSRNMEYRPILMARPKIISDMARSKSRREYLQAQANMHPSNRSIDNKYGRIVRDEEITKLTREGLGIPSNFNAVAAGQTDARRSPLPVRTTTRFDADAGVFVPAEASAGITSASASAVKKTP